MCQDSRCSRCVGDEHIGVAASQNRKDGWNCGRAAGAEDKDALLR
jgi:hypothetical protein